MIASYRERKEEKAGDDFWHYHYDVYIGVGDEQELIATCKSEDDAYMIIKALTEYSISGRAW